MTSLVPRDEREIAVDLAADRLTSLVLAYGLLILAAIRGFNGEAAWDLLGLVMLGGAVGLAYRAWKRAVSPRWSMVMLGTLAVAGLVAALVALQLPR